MLSRFLLLLLPTGFISVQSQEPSCPSLPIWFSASYLYTNSDASLALFATGYYGVYGENEYDFHTWRLDLSTNPTNDAPSPVLLPLEDDNTVYPPSSPSSSSPSLSSSLWDTTVSTLSTLSSSFLSSSSTLNPSPLHSPPVTPLRTNNYLGNYSIQSIIFERNGSLSEHTYWIDQHNTMQCTNALIPVGDTTDGLVLNWLDQDGSPPCTGIIYIGNETIHQRYYGNITVQHWSSPDTCQDIYILDVDTAIQKGLYYPRTREPSKSTSSSSSSLSSSFANDDHDHYTTNNSSSSSSSSFSLSVRDTTAIPVRYTVAEGPNCAFRNRTFDYFSLYELSYYMAVQSSPLFALPLTCYGNVTNNANGNVDTDNQIMVPLVWTIVAAALSAFSGTVLGALIVRNRQLRAWRRWIQGSSTSNKTTTSAHVSVFGPSNGSIQDSYTTLGYSQRLMDVV